MRYAGAFAIALCALLMLGAKQAPANTEVPPSINTLRFRFPLWKDVPGESFAVLGHGVRRGTEWAAFASRASKARRSKENPCITVAAFSKYGDYGDAGSCGPLAPEKGVGHPPVFPLYGEGVAAFFAASFSHVVASVKIEFGSGRIIEKTPRLLSIQQAKKAHLPRFRYIAMSLPEDVCIAKITGFDWMRAVILNAETGEC